MKEYLSKVESSLGLSAGVVALAYSQNVPMHLIVPYGIIAFLSGYFGKKFLGNVITAEQSAEQSADKKA